MFTEYPEQIKQLRARDKRFDYLCDKHSTLDAEIQALLNRKSPSLQLEIEQLKNRSCASRKSSTPCCSRRCQNWS